VVKAVNTRLVDMGMLSMETYAIMVLASWPVNKCALVLSKNLTFQMDIINHQTGKCMALKGVFLLL